MSTLLECPTCGAPTLGHDLEAERACTDPWHEYEDEVPVTVDEQDRVNVSLDILNLEYTIMVVEREYPEDDLGVVSFLRSLIRTLVKRMNNG